MGVQNTVIALYHRAMVRIKVVDLSMWYPQHCGHMLPTVSSCPFPFPSHVVPEPHAVYTTQDGGHHQVEGEGVQWPSRLAMSSYAGGGFAGVYFISSVSRPIGLAHTLVCDSVRGWLCADPWPGSHCGHTQSPGHTFSPNLLTEFTRPQTG